MWRQRRVGAVAQAELDDVRHGRVRLARFGLQVERERAVDERRVVVLDEGGEVGPRARGATDGGRASVEEVVEVALLFVPGDPVLLLAFLILRMWGVSKEQKDIRMEE